MQKSGCRQPKKGVFSARCKASEIHLWNVDSGPEQLQVLPHLLWLELGVENCQLCEHPHVCSLQSKRCFQHSDQLFKVTTILRDTDRDISHQEPSRIPDFDRVAMTDLTVQQAVSLITW